MPSGLRTPAPSWAVAHAIGLIALVGAVCYANSLDGEFVFDDIESIPGNPSIRSFGSAWSPPPCTTVDGRPLANASFALNYALNGLDVSGFHLFNIVLHVATAVAIFVLARGTLLLPAIPDVFRARATEIALAVGLLWVAHPLGTEVVSYTVQRCEGLAALFTVLTLCGLLWGDRSAHGAAARAYVGSIAACSLGVLSKETAVVAPVLAILYDRAFLAGSFREVIRRRWWVHAGLFSTWLLAGWLVCSTAGRGGTAGLGAGVSPWHYAAIQAGWVLHYLRLSIWPDPLVFDYGPTVGPVETGTWVSSAVVLALLVLTVILCIRRSRIGFLPVAFVLLLAPSSSFIPVATQVAAERRIYLALAIVITGVVILAVWAGSRLSVTEPVRQRVLVGLLVACVVLFGTLTRIRNEDYRTACALWTDTAEKMPDNARARTNAGRELLARSRTADAVAQLRIAVALAPDDPRPHNMLGFALLAQRELGAAITSFREVVRLAPNSSEATANLAMVLQMAGRPEEAIDWYCKAIALAPENADAHFGLGQALRSLGREREAQESFSTAARLKPVMPPPHP